MGAKDRIDGMLRAATAAGRVPGVVAVVGRRAGTVYEGAFGKRSLDAAAEMTADTVVWLASMTKAVTGAAAMQLVERGKLSLDAPAQQWVPMLAEVQVLEGFAGDRPILRAPRRPITLRRLLAHTAGFAYEFWDAGIQRYQKVTGLPSMITCTLDSLRMPLRFDPGDRWLYGIGIDFAGLMVEAVSGKRLGAYLREHLFEPLGMKDTAFRLTPELESRRAKMHLRAENGTLASSELVIEQDPGFDMGGGALYSTAGDYMRFCRMILNRGELDSVRVLAPETVAEMSRDQLGTLSTTPLATAAPSMTHDFDFFPEIDKGWGLTFQINRSEAPTGRSAGSLAWAGLCNSYYWIDPQRDLCGVYLSQILPFVDPESYPLYLAFETASYQGFA